MPKEIYCKQCDGTEIVHEAGRRWDVVWDAVTQDFVKQNFVDFDTQERKFCCTCDADVDYVWREITDVKTLAKIVIHKEDT